MSKDNVEDLINSALDRKQPMYLRKGWVIRARSQIDQLDREVKILEKRLLKNSAIAKTNSG